VLAGFHKTLFTRQREVEGSRVGGMGLHNGRRGHKSNRGSGSSPVGRNSSSSSHRKFVSVFVGQLSSVINKKKYFNFIQTMLAGSAS
jgi:hypothetical protein